MKNNINTYKEENCPHIINHLLLLYDWLEKEQRLQLKKDYIKFIGDCRYFPKELIFEVVLSLFMKYEKNYVQVPELKKHDSVSKTGRIQ